MATCWKLPLKCPSKWCHRPHCRLCFPLGVTTNGTISSLICFGVGSPFVLSLRYCSFRRINTLFSANFHAKQNKNKKKIKRKQTISKNIARTDTERQLQLLRRFLHFLGIFVKDWCLANSSKGQNIYGPWVLSVYPEIVFPLHVVIVDQLAQTKQKQEKRHKNKRKVSCAI